jgi:hypothetical protein
VDLSGISEIVFELKFRWTWFVGHRPQWSTIHVLPVAMAGREAHRSSANGRSGRREAATMAQRVGGEYANAYWQQKMDGGVAGFGQRRTWTAVVAIARWRWCFNREGGKVDAGSSEVWDGEEFCTFYRGR